MSVITISRGTFSGGKALAECLARNLGYRCIDRDVIVERAAAHGVSQNDIRAALEKPPTFLNRFNHKRYIYLALVQNALAEEVRTGSAIYHGLGGHLLLRGAAPVLRLRIIAPLEFRIRMAQERLKLGRAEVIAYIERMDEDRQKWTQYLYGVNWGDPSLYDLVINLEHVSIDQACTLVSSIARDRCFEFSPECQAAMDALVLASRVRVELALTPFTANLEVEVEARGGEVVIKGRLYDQAEDVYRVAQAVPGVTGVTIEELAAVPDA